MLPVLNLLVIYSKEPEKLAAFYETFGMSFAKHRHGNGPEHFAAEGENGFVFEIYPTKEGESGTRVRLGFRVPSVDDSVAHLSASGATIVTPARQSEWGRRAVIADPDGNRIELTEMAQ